MVNSHEKSNYSQKSNYNKLKAVWTLLKIIRLATHYMYHFAKVKLGEDRILIYQNYSLCHYDIITDHHRFSQEHLTKSELGQAGTLPKIACCAQGHNFWLLPRPRRGLRCIVFTLSVCMCASVCLCVCPANILVFYFSAIRRYIDLKFIQDTYRVVLN